MFGIKFVCISFLFSQSWLFRFVCKVFGPYPYLLFAAISYFFAKASLRVPGDVLASLGKLKWIL